MKCPKCQSDMYDNRGQKDNPKKPDFVCSNKNCLDPTGRYKTSAWINGNVVKFNDGKEYKINTGNGTQEKTAPKSNGYSNEIRLKAYEIAGHFVSELIKLGEQIEHPAKKIADIGDSLTLRLSRPLFDKNGEQKPDSQSRA
jgi:hypothetical protein